MSLTHLIISLHNLSLINKQKGLSDSEIERMVQEAESQKDVDRARRELVEAKNEADAVSFFFSFFPLFFFFY